MNKEKKQVLGWNYVVVAYVFFCIKVVSVANIVVITAIHMIMAVILEKENNLIYAILVHLFFNLPYTFINVDIMFYVIIMVVYTIEVIGFLLYRKLSTHQ